MMREKEKQKQLTEDEAARETMAMTGTEAWTLIQSLKTVFENVHLVDAKAEQELILDSTGAYKKVPYCCHAGRKNAERCEACITEKCLTYKRKFGKYEFAGDAVFYVIATYLEVDGAPCCLKLVSRIHEDTLFTGYDKSDIMKMMIEHNKKFYLDPVAEVYNRRYYEEQLGDWKSADAVAFMDVDNFKRINDTYGHQTGDLALKLIAGAVCSSVRRSDLVIRYGGDEFIVVFESIPREVFSRKLQDISEHVSALTMEEQPDIRLSVSVGGIYGPGRIRDMLKAADERMYQVKRNKNVRE